jgi:hypothetical protein
MKIEHYCEPKSKIVNQLGQAVLLESNGRHFLIEEATQDLAQAEEWESMLAPGTPQG